MSHIGIKATYLQYMMALGVSFTSDLNLAMYHSSVLSKSLAFSIFRRTLGLNVLKRRNTNLRGKEKN